MIKKEIAFRNDDVNPNSNLDDIREMYKTLKELVPNVKIYTAVNILAKKNDSGRPYPPMYFKNVDINDVDMVWNLETKGLENIISHGLAHFDHRHSSEELQKFSILTSCKLLNTKIFIAPFTRVSNYTKAMCKENKIDMWNRQRWENFDNKPMDLTKSHFLMHSWKFTPETFREKLLKDLEATKEVDIINNQEENNE